MISRLWNKARIYASKAQAHFEFGMYYFYLPTLIAVGNKLINKGIYCAHKTLKQGQQMIR